MLMQLGMSSSYSMDTSVSSGRTRTVFCTNPHQAPAIAYPGGPIQLSTPAAFPVGPIRWVHVATQGWVHSGARYRRLAAQSGVDYNKGKGPDIKAEDRAEGDGLRRIGPAVADIVLLDEHELE